MAGENQQWAVVYWNSKRKAWRKRSGLTHREAREFFASCEKRELRYLHRSAAGWLMASETMPRLFCGNIEVRV